MWHMFRRNAKPNPRVEERIKQLELELVDTKSDLEVLNRKHHKLSGAYYSRFGAKAPDPSPTSQSSLSGADILARVGYVPGRPMPKLE